MGNFQRQNPDSPFQLPGAHRPEHLIADDVTPEIFRQSRIAEYWDQIRACRTAKNLAAALDLAKGAVLPLLDEYLVRQDRRPIIDLNCTAAYSLVSSSERALGYLMSADSRQNNAADAFRRAFQDRGRRNEQFSLIDEKIHFCIAANYAPPYADYLAERKDILLENNAKALQRDLVDIIEYLTLFREHPAAVRAVLSPEDIVEASAVKLQTLLVYESVFPGDFITRRSITDEVASIHSFATATRVPKRILYSAIARAFSAANSSVEDVNYANHLIDDAIDDIHESDTDAQTQKARLNCMAAFNLLRLDPPNLSVFELSVEYAEEALQCLADIGEKAGRSALAMQSRLIAMHARNFQGIYDLDDLGDIHDILTSYDRRLTPKARDGVFQLPGNDAPGINLAFQMFSSAVKNVQGQKTDLIHSTVQRLQFEEWRTLTKRSVLACFAM